MAENIRLWKVGDESNTGPAAIPLEEVLTSETEQRLEELLVASPELLLPGLKLIGRQVPTSGGPLDLIGVDSAGQLVIFELKRGTLTRDAVSQILDYASDLIARDPDDFADLVSTHSGQRGISTIEDFTDWWQGQFPSATEPPPANPRLVLVGLGADERAKRIVNYLAASGLDIQLLTFQAFRSGTDTLLARRVETAEPTATRKAGSGGTKEGNRRLLFELAREQGVEDLLREVADFIDEHLPAYRWPAKTCFTFGLQERTDQGRPTARNYAALWVDRKTKGTVLFTLPELVLESAPELVKQALKDLPDARRTDSMWTPFELPIKTSSWPEIRNSLRGLLGGLEHTWKQRVAAQDALNSEDEA